MGLSKESKRFLIFGIFAGALAIVFTLLYYYNIIKYLDLYLCVTYVVYFAGLALFYNGKYCNSREKNKAKVANYILSFVLVSISIALLIYGFVSGQVSLFN